MELKALSKMCLCRGHEDNRILKLQSGLRIAFQGLEINNERVLHSKYGVVVKVLVDAVKYLSGHWLVSFSLNL